jgi:hypothetical protein
MIWHSIKKIPLNFLRTIMNMEIELHIKYISFFSETSAVQISNKYLLIQISCFWTLSIILSLSKNTILFVFQNTKFWILDSVSTFRLGPINRASPHLQTPAPTQVGIYKQAQHKPSVRVMTKHQKLPCIGAGVRTEGLVLSIGPKWVGFMCRRRQNPISKMLCSKKQTGQCF